MGGLAFSFFYAAMSIPLARLAERKSRVRIISFVTALWSLMTMLSGAAGSFVQLLLARIGVGVGEAGFTPALLSMISDRFEPERRATVFSLIAVSVSIGGAVAALGGGLIAHQFGWRMTFVIVGAPGLLLALLLLLTVPEPQRPKTQATTPSFMAVLRRVSKSRSFVSLTVGSGMVALVGFGLSLFLIPLLVRRFGFDLREAGLMFALSFSMATALGTLAGGYITDRLVTKNVAYYGLAPAIAMVIALPFYLIAIWQDDWRLMAGALFIATLCLYAFLPAIMTATQRLVEPQMRATAAAIHAFGQTVFGLGLGSVLLGGISDKLAHDYYPGDYQTDCLGSGVASAACTAASGSGLQQAMLLVGLALAAALSLYWIAARNIRREICAIEEKL